MINPTRSKGPEPTKANKEDCLLYKKSLLAKLLNGVKTCQSRFGSRTELATEDEETVRQLCNIFEEIFLHGVKNEKSSGNVNPVQQFKESLVPFSFWSSERPAFWRVLKSILSKHEAERFLLLHKVRTDIGRCRAWLRAALNEHSLERYILILLSKEDIGDYYESWAFLQDTELTSILPQTAAGLGSVLFALSLDNGDLDKIQKTAEKIVMEPEATLAHELAEKSVTSIHSNASSDDGKGKKQVTKRKKKKPPTNYVSFDDPTEETKGSPKTSMPKDIKPVIERSTLANLTLSRDREEKSLDIETIASKEDIKSKETDKPSKDSYLNVDEDDGGPAAFSSSWKSADCISMYSDCSDRLENGNVGLNISGVLPSQRLKPVVFGDQVSTSSKVPEADKDNYQDLIPLPSFDDNDTNGEEDRLVTGNKLTLPIQNVSTAENSSYDIKSPTTPSIGSESASISEHHAKGAETHHRSDRTHIGGISGYSGTKENVNFFKGQDSNDDEKVTKLKMVLDHEVELVATLKAQLSDEQRKSNDKIKMFESRYDAVSKENDILKQQLKKYVCAVQMLKKQRPSSSSQHSISFKDEVMMTDEQLLASVEINDANDAASEAAEYERKLIQVAEMHGELMEFNAYLQKCLQKKSAAVQRLKEELIDLRGPLAAPILSDEDGEESWDIIEYGVSAESETQGDNTSSPVRRLTYFRTSFNERVLINIWIPSVFLTGASNDLHHVYQVFLRIKDTEWNVYRRYSQFYSLYKDLKKKDPEVGMFYFPPKKHLGNNKDSKFVDERRRKLQEFLRNIINHTLQTNSILASHPDKNLLISILPFFGENFSQSQKNQVSQRRERSQSRSRLFFRQSANTQNMHGVSGSPQYTGL